MASILEVSPGGKRYFNVFDAAPENEVSTRSIWADSSVMDQPNNNKAKYVNVATKLTTGY
jgi:hypothetical protein